MSKQIANPQTAAQPVKAGQKQVIKITKGQHLRVQDLVEGGAAKDAANVVVTKAGKALALQFADGTVLQVENFYEECAGNGCSVTVAGKEAGGYTITGETAVGAAAQDGSQLVYAYGEQTSLMAMAGSDASIGTALSALGNGTVAYIPAAAQGPGWGALAALAGGLGVAGAAGGGGGAAATGAAGGGATAVQILLKGVFVAGPVVAGNGLEAKAYGANGQLLGTGVLANDGTFELNLGNYTGPVLVAVTDKDSGADYWDEATGAPKDLSVAMLRAATYAPVGGSGTIHVNVNVFTEAAARLLGADGVNLPTGASAGTIAAANKKVADALGLQQDIVAGESPIAVVTNTGAGNQNANTYGKLLAGASGVDEAGSTEQTIQALLGAVQDAVNPVLTTSALLLRGAANVVDKVPGFLTQAQMSLNDYFFIADTVNKLRHELAGDLKVGDYATVKALSDALHAVSGKITALEGEMGEDGLFATALRALQEAVGAPSVPGVGGNPSIAATGLYLVIENAVSSAVTVLEIKIGNLQSQITSNDGDIAALINDAKGTSGQEGYVAPTMGSLAGLKAAIDALKTSGSAALQEAVGAPTVYESDGTTVKTAATGLYLVIENAVSAAVNDLQAKIDALAGDLGQGDYSTVKALSDALKALDGVVGKNNTTLSDKIGAPADNSDPEHPVAATGLYLVIENAVSNAVTALETKITDLQSQITSNDGDIAALIDDTNAVSNTTGKPTTGSLAGLKAAIDALSATSGGNVTALQTAVGAPTVYETDGTTVKTAATGLYKLIADIEARFDVTAPTISDISLSATGADSLGHLNAGDVVTATVKFSEAVLVTGTPQLQLQIGNDTVLATYARGAGTDSLVFTYTILATQTDANGISVPANALQLDAARIHDAAGNPAKLTTGVIADNAEFIVDNGPLELTHPADTLFQAGETPSTAFLAQIAGHTPSDVVLHLTSPLTVAQAAKLVELGFDLLHKATYTIRDYDTTVQAAMLNPATAAVVRGATLVTAIGDELANAMRFTSFDSSVNLRIEGGDGNDTIDTGKGTEQIVGGLGADTINLTYKDTSEDTVIYQTIYDGKTQPVVELVFSANAQDYREGSVLTAHITTTVYTIVNGKEKAQTHTYTDSYTVKAGDTPADAMEALAVQIRNDFGVQGVIVRDNVLEIFGETCTLTKNGVGYEKVAKLAVTADDAIVNPGQKTVWKVEFSDAAADYPGHMSLLDTFTIDRKVSITIEGVKVEASIVYKQDGTPDPEATLLALKAAILAKMAVDTDPDMADNQHGALYDVLSAVSIEANGASKGVVLVLTGKSAPDSDSAVPTFTVDSASIEVAGEQQQTEVSFSGNPADYYEGGTLSVTINGKTVSAAMVAGNSKASLQALATAIKGDAVLGSLVEDVSAGEKPAGTATVLGLDYVGWYAPGGGTTRDLNETAFNAALSTFGKFTVPWVEVNGYGIATSSYDASELIKVGVNVVRVDTSYSSMAEWTAAVSDKFSTMTGRTIAVTYDPSNGHISFGGYGGATRFGFDGFVFQNSVPNIVLTAHDEGSNPFGTVDAHQSYAGEAQHATIDLENAVSISYGAYSDGTATTRGAQVYYQGGKVYATVHGAGADGILGNDDDVSVTVSAAMGKDDASTTGNLMAAINTAASGEGALVGIIAANGASVDANGVIHLTAATTGESTFEVSDVRLDYAGVNQLATADFSSTTNADYYTGGKLHFDLKQAGVDGIMGTPDDVTVTITADMVKGDAKASLDALRAQIQKEIDGAGLPAAVRIAGSYHSSDLLYGPSYLAGSGYLAQSLNVLVSVNGVEQFSVKSNNVYADNLASLPYQTLGELLTGISTGHGLHAYLDAAGAIVIETEATGAGVTLSVNEFTSFQGTGIYVYGEDNLSASGIDGGSGLLTGIIESVSVDEFGVITLTSAQKVQHAFDISKAQIDEYHLAYAGVKQTASASFDAGDSSYYNVPGYGTNGTLSQIGLTLHGREFTQAMITANLPNGWTRADKTVDALTEQILAARNWTVAVDGPEKGAFAVWLNANIGDVARRGNEIVFTAMNPSVSDTIGLGESFMTVAPVTQMTQIDLSGINFDPRKDAAGHAAKVELTIAGTTVVADVGADNVTTLANLKAAIEAQMADGKPLFSVLGAVDLKDGVFTLTAKVAGADPLHVGTVQHQVEDAASPDSKPQKVLLDFADGVFDDPAQTPEGTVVTVKIDGIEASVTITAELLQGVRAELRSETIVTALKGAIVAAAAEAQGSTVGVVEQGYLDRGVFTPVSESGLQDGDNVLRITAKVNGAYTLGRVTEGTLSITVVEPGANPGDLGVSVPLSTTVTVAQAGNLGYKWSTDNVVSDVTTGRDEGRYSDTAGADPVFTVGQATPTGSDAGVSLTVTDTAGEDAKAAYTDQVGQIITNPGLGEDGNSGYYGDAAQTGAVDAGVFNGQGVQQTHTNPGNGYTADAGSPQANATGTTQGDGTLHGSNAGYYADDGLHTTYLNGGTASGAVGTDGTYLYTAGNRDHVIDLDATVHVGAAAGSATVALGEGAYQNGFASFTGDSASVHYESLGNLAPDTIHNFQTDHDFISLEGALLASTVVGPVEELYAEVTYGQPITTYFGNLAGGTPGFYGRLNDVSLALKVESVSEGFDFQGSVNLLAYGGNDGRVYQLGLKYQYSTGGEKVHFSSVADFVDAIEQSAVLSVTGDEARTANRNLVAAHGLDWSLVNGNLVLSVSHEAFSNGDSAAWSDAASDVNVNYYLYNAQQFHTKFNLDLNEFGMVDALHSSLDASDLGDANAVATQLNQLFSFSANGADSALNTSVFAVTAQDDPNVTALWAHRQSSASDHTVSAIELYQLAQVNTLGHEFDWHNFVQTQTQPI